jgi:cytidylate kinase
LTGGRTGPVVAIDGTAGSGKSTLARALAVELGLPYVNTGLMYRALTARVLEGRVDLEDGPTIANLAQQITFDLDRTVTPPAISIDGCPPSEALVTPEVEASVSAVSRHPEVRAVMARDQRRLGAGGAVMEGRDIGSVIFPDADVKLFLEAAPDERVSRRARERLDAAQPAEALIERDRLDSRVNLFVPAPGATRLDTTGKTPEDVQQEALRIARAIIGGRSE